MTRTRFTYPVTLDAEADGAFSVSFGDLPEALTHGRDRAEALAQAADCLEEALANRIVERLAIPRPSAAKGRPTVAPGAVIAAKAALATALTESGTSRNALARALQVQSVEIRRMLDPRHATKIGRLEEALAVLGRRLVVTVEAA
jgi:antitoxin HicB